MTAQFSIRTLVLFLIVFATLVFSQETGARYLIITHDNFYDAIIPYAQWKHKMGFKTKIVRVPSELAQNSTSIRNYIVNAYNNWQIRPEFILFVGAPNYIPWSFSSSPYGDNNYTNMDADIYNEILSGRLNVHSITEAQTVVAKMLRYERYPDISDTLWLRKGCTIVRDIQDDDSITYRLDAQYVAGHMVNNGYVKVDTFFASRGDNANSIIYATNEGRAFVVYRGTATNNWYNPFAVNPNNLSNGNKLPIVISATCGTLGTGSTATVAEQWFLTGTPTNLRGAAGYFATTTSITNGAHLRSAVTRGFFDGVFQYERLTFGEACEDGRLRVYNTYGATNEYRGFTTIGDPAMQIWTTTPKPITVVHDSFLLASIEETLQVTVQYQGTPVESALVCIMYDTLIYQTGWTDNSGIKTFTFNVPDTGIMHITVTGRNIYPYEGTIAIIAGTELIVYQNCLINDSLGNNNGIIDPGEVILLWTSLKNIGLYTVENVKALLRTTDTTVIISDSLSLYGDIIPGATTNGLTPFVFAVSPKTYEHLIPFELVITDSNNHTWLANFSLATTGASSRNNATGPDQYGYYIYDDTDTLTGNAPTYTWFEIAPPAGGPGQIIPEITDEDADTVTLSLPFDFKFYGIDYNTIGVCSNGFVEIGGATYPYSYNDPIPTIGRAKRYASPFWDDLNPSPMQMGHGDIYRYYDPENNLWYVEFYQVALGYGNNAWQTFQIVLRDPQYYPTPTGDGELLFYYHTVSNVTSSTVGIEDETETRGLQYLYNNNYDQNAMHIQNGRALLVTTKPPNNPHSPWINLVSFAINDSAGGNSNGIPEPNEIVEMTLFIKNNGDTVVADVTGTLSTSSPSVSIMDSIASFGNLDIGATADNASNPYVIQIGETPEDTLVGLVVHLTGNNGHYNTFAYLTLRIHYQANIEEFAAKNTTHRMLQVYPNPFQNHLVIKFQIPNNSEIRNSQSEIEPNLSTRYSLLATLRIYDATGRLVKTFSDIQCKTSNSVHSVTWPGTDALGRKLPAGVYFVRLETESFYEIEKVILIR